MNISNIDLSFEQNQIYVEFTHQFKKPIKQFTFIINSDLVIDSISYNKNNLNWEKIKEYTPLFRPKSQEILVNNNLDFDNIKITYHGEINGWCNIIEDKRRAISCYSTWYPQKTSVDIGDILIKLHNSEDYFVINGRYDNSEKVWLYGGNGYDTGNIIALKKGQYYEVGNDNFKFYYVSKDDELAGKYLNFYIKDICKYYKTNLYKQSDKQLQKINVVSLDMKNPCGGYFRKELIVTDSFSYKNTDNNLKQSMAKFIAHEIGHTWGTGADTETWEDWLNETVAEWSAFMYAIFIKDNELFDNMLNKYKNKYLDYPAIKTEDGSRPDGVHEKGTMLFYYIYKKYGYETIKEMLNCFDRLRSPKTTDAYLKALNDSVCDDVAKLVEKGLTMKCFEKLL